jgi:hypothetical protein
MRTIYDTIAASSKRCALLTLILSLFASVSWAEQTPELLASPKISNETADGRCVCAADGGLSQVPGHPDFFVGRGAGVGTLDDCHHPPLDAKGNQLWRSFLALYRMDWKRNKLVLVNYLLKLPDRTIPSLRTNDGVYIGDAYDPYVASFKGEIWVAFEAVIGFHSISGCGSCIAPLSPDLKHLDISRMTLLVQPKQNNERSASTPVLLNFHNRLYAYWTLDPPDQLSRLPQNKLVTRGMELELDDRGRMWGKGSGGQPVTTDDPRLTSLVYDVDPHDSTANHAVNLMYAEPFGDKILTIACIGGECAGEVCRSPHQTNPGAWRMSLALADQPLGTNALRARIIHLPDLPGNVVSYPRLATDPNGHRVLFGVFEAPRKLGVDPDDVQFQPGSLNLTAGEAVKTSAGTFTLQGQGNLVLYDENRTAVWSSAKCEKKNEPDFRAGFQGDGNFVVYRGNKPYWSSETAGNPEATLVLSKSKPFVSIVDKKRRLLLWPWHITPWPINPVASPTIPSGFHYLPFDSYLKAI